MKLSPEEIARFERDGYLFFPSLFKPGEIKTLTDDLYGDITTVQGEVKSTDCNSLIDTTVGPSASSATCTYTVEYADPGTSGDVTNTVTAGVEDTGNGSKTDLTGSTTVNVELNVAP